MSDLRHRAAAAANEIADLRDAAYLAGDNELATELKPLDKLLGGRRGSVTLGAYESLRAGLEERLRQEIEAETAAKAEADFEHVREHLYAYLSKSARSEAEHALTEQRREVEAEALHLEARDATITARENTWTRHCNRAVALGAIPAVVLTTTIQAVL